jgi:FHS family L-fucose permease-like MFS transporter
MFYRNLDTKDISAGLLLSAFGSFMFVPAATMESFPFFLTALFTVGLGFSIQQIANPLAIKMEALILVHTA